MFTKTKLGTLNLAISKTKKLNRISQAITKKNFELPHKTSAKSNTSVIQR